MSADRNQSARVEALGGEDASYHQLFDAVPCYVSVQDRNYRIVQANRTFQDAFGDQVGEFCYHAYKGRSERCESCNVALTFEDGVVHSGEETVRSQKGEVMQMMVFASPLKDEHGDVDSVMEMSVNITEAKVLQERLASLGSLIAGISHSIKGIAMGLDGSLYVVNSGFRSDRADVVKKGWDMVERNVHRISDMVLDILYCSKEREPERETTSPAQVARDACDLLESKAKQFGVELKRSIPDRLGEFSVDAERIHAVLINLITNGIDACFTDSDEREHFVKLSVEGTPSRVLFSVTDNGIGMNEERRENLFSAFRSSKGAKGTGLGLFMSKKVTEEHGGDIRVDSEPGKGSTFTLRIPRTPPVSTE